ncbi:hypothetical protein [Devosia nitrariae]|uniref:hypothetical protein n=1 Tax=Devosia nitrariae TaxID=2071872 RepID=UPI0024E09559|nr:hypothetical protein [Devosia nitrariae]
MLARKEIVFGLEREPAQIESHPDVHRRADGQHCEDNDADEKPVLDRPGRLPRQRRDERCDPAGKDDEREAQRLPRARDQRPLERVSVTHQPGKQPVEIVADQQRQQDGDAKDEEVGDRGRHQGEKPGQRSIDAGESLIHETPATLAMVSCSRTAPDTGSKIRRQFNFTL